MKKVLIFLALILFVRCTQKIAGTTDETLGGNKTAAIYYAGGAPAPGVTVKVFDVIDTSRVPVAQAVTDSAGHYALGQVAKGTYNIWAEQDTLVAVQDSVFISPNSNTIQHDTLHTSGSITAIIGMQPNDDPRSAYVQILGSDRFSRNIDADGFFTISGLATGSYSLRISTTLPNYTPIRRGNETCLYRNPGRYRPVRFLRYCKRHRAFNVELNVVPGFPGLSGFSGSVRFDTAFDTSD